jgi:hypothetical protein
MEWRHDRREERVGGRFLRPLAERSDLFVARSAQRRDSKIREETKGMNRPRLVLVIAAVVAVAAAMAVSARAGPSNATPAAICSSGVLLPVGPPADWSSFSSKGACISALRAGQSVFGYYGIIGGPGSGNFAVDGLMINASGTVTDFVLFAGPALSFCWTAYVFDSNEHVLATATVSSPGELKMVPLTGVYFQPPPGRAHAVVLNRSNIGGGGGAVCQ